MSKKNKSLTYHMEFSSIFINRSKADDSLRLLLNNNNQIMLTVHRRVESKDWYHCPHLFPGSCTWFVEDEQYPRDNLKTDLTYNIEIEANNSLGSVVSQYSVDTRYIGNTRSISNPDVTSQRIL